uniref:Uncharacterized protein n=1 Tax=virus sp. ct1Uu26 TaxID=2826789 RepID=A0A8S5R904_9VIRU|nr:MAG TPA: hypothetical protein [virus sp. ct1Uu26]
MIKLTKNLNLRSILVLLLRTQNAKNSSLKSKIDSLNHEITR